MFGKSKLRYSGGLVHRRVFLCDDYVHLFVHQRDHDDPVQNVFRRFVCVPTRAHFPTGIAFRHRRVRSYVGDLITQAVLTHITACTEFARSARCR